MLIQKLNSFMRHWRYHRLFPHECYGCFRGVYQSFDEAMKDAPKTKGIGYDNEELARWYFDEMDTDVHEYDYPVMFWLNKVLESRSRVVDFGGNVGIHFLIYRKYFPFPEHIDWTVVDVPEIVKIARDGLNESGLNFTEKLNADTEADVFLASGSAQYVEDFSGLLKSMSTLPKHLLLNRLPLHDDKQYVTLQNGGTVFYPQFVFHRSEFIASLEALGYRLKDSWTDRAGGCFIPFHPKHSLQHYSGLYLQLDEKG